MQNRVHRIHSNRPGIVHQDVSNLEQLLNLIAQAARKQERVTVSTVVEVAGTRSFGTLLLLVGLILVSPLSGIPGMATTMAILVLLIAVQLLLGRRHFWLPQWLLLRSVKPYPVLRAVALLRRPARFLDRWIRPRLTFLVHRTGTYVIALVCTIIALAMPTMELIPFSATTAGVPLTFFGLALFAQDGVVALIALALAGLVAGLITYNVLY